MSTPSATERDQDLWDRWRRGDASAGARLFQLYETALYGLIRRLGIREDADVEDIYSEVILNLTEYKDKRELESSFFGLARRVAISRVVRQRQRAPFATTSEHLDDLATNPGAPEAERGAILEALQSCLAKLRNPFEQELFRERFLEGWDNQALAQRHQKTPNHIAVVLHRAVTQMRRCLSHAGYGAGHSVAH